MDVEHSNLEIELRLKTDHLAISAAIRFADRTEQGNNVVLAKFFPLINGANPLHGGAESNILTSSTHPSNQLSEPQS